MGSSKVIKHKKKKSTPKYVGGRSPKDAEGYESETEDDKKPLIKKRKEKRDKIKVSVGRK